MTTKLSLALTSLALLLPAVVTALNCSGPVDLVVAVPAGLGLVPDGEWSQVELFLERLVDFLGARPGVLRLGLVLYGPQPTTVAELEPWLLAPGMRARATLLGQRDVLAPRLGYTPTLTLPNVPLAISALHRIMNNGRRPGATQVGLVFTLSTEDASSTDEAVVQENVSSAAARARADNIALVAVSYKGTIPGFDNITNDRCRVFSLRNYRRLATSLVPFVASTICYVLDTTVHPSPSNCFPERVQVPPIPSPTPEELGCEPGKCKAVADERNCAYYNLCSTAPGDSPRVLRRQPCPPDSLFDPRIRRCNHKEAVPCYSGLDCLTPTGLFPHPRACGLFLNCYDGIAYVQNCSAGLWFDSRSERCQLPDSSDCPLSA